MNKHVLSTAVLGFGLLAGAVNAEACALGAVKYNGVGEQQLTGVDGNGQQIGTTLRGRDGRWEAVIKGLGALNQRYGSAWAAAQAICKEAQR
jgi:hypothetical protein